MISHENLLFISSNVNAFINSYQKNLPNLESGGIILGKILSCKHILIEELTVPSAKDKRGLYFFERDKNSAQKIINTRWHESRGETIYLGEWHTHNEDNPKPSKRDLSMIKNQLITSKMEINFLLLLIIGQKRNYFGIETDTGHHAIKTSNNPFCFYINLIQ